MQPSIFLTKAIVDWSYAFIAAVSVKAMAFTLSIYSFDYSARSKPFLAVCLAKQMPSHMVTNWHLPPSSRPPILIKACRFNTSPINSSWSFRICPFSCCSRRCHLCIHAIVSPSLLTNKYLGSDSINGTTSFYTLTSSPFYMVIPSDNSIWVYCDSDSNT